MLNIGDIQVGVDIATAASIVGAIIGFNISNWKTRKQSHNDFLIRELRKGIDDFSSLRYEVFKLKNTYRGRSIEFNLIREKEKDKKVLEDSANNLIREYDRILSEIFDQKEFTLDILDIIVTFLCKNDSDEVSKIKSKIEENYSKLLADTAAVDGSKRIEALENSLNEMKGVLLGVLSRLIR